jgi:predicted phosphodiesterase
VFYGHSHTYVYGWREGKHLINLPAVGYNFNDDQPVGWMNGRFHKQGVDLTLNAFGGNLNDHGKTVSLRW